MYEMKKVTYGERNSGARTHQVRAPDDDDTATDPLLGKQGLPCRVPAQADTQDEVVVDGIRMAEVNVSLECVHEQRRIYNAAGHNAEHVLGVPGIPAAPRRVRHTRLRCRRVLVHRCLSLPVRIRGRRCRRYLLGHRPGPMVPLVEGNGDETARCLLHITARLPRSLSRSYRLPPNLLPRADGPCCNVRHVLALATTCMVEPEDRDTRYLGQTLRLLAGGRLDRALGARKLGEPVDIYQQARYQPRRFGYGRRWWKRRDIHWVRRYRCRCRRGVDWWHDG